MYSQFQCDEMGIYYKKEKKRKINLDDGAESF